jgi:hypothetical protein
MPISPSGKAFDSSIPIATQKDAEAHEMELKLSLLGAMSLYCDQDVPFHPNALVCEVVLPVAVDCMAMQKFADGHDME